MQSFVLGRFLTAELWDTPFVREGGADKRNTEDLDSFEFATHVFLSPRDLLAVRFFRSGSHAEVTVFGDPRFEDFTVAKDSPVQPSWEVGLPEIRRPPKRQFETFVKLEHIH